MRWDRATDRQRTTRYVALDGGSEKVSVSRVDLLPSLPILLEQDSYQLDDGNVEVSLYGTQDWIERSIGRKKCQEAHQGRLQIISTQEPSCARTVVSHTAPCDELKLTRAAICWRIRGPVACSGSDLELLWPHAVVAPPQMTNVG